MTTNIGIVLLIILFSVYGFTRDKLRSDWVAIMAMSALILFGILTPTEAISGFSNEATLTVAAMFAISAAFVSSGFINYIEKLILKFVFLGPVIIIVLLTFFTAVLSSFLNNTAVVAIFIPLALRLSKKFELDSRKVLMPLSFAAIVGGTCTLVGTSTNILVNSIYIKSGAKGFTMFEFSYIGIILSVVVFVYLNLIGLKFLTKQVKVEDEKENVYLTSIVIEPEGELVEAVFYDTTLYKNYSGEVIKLSRNGENMAIDETLTLKAQDVIRISCDVHKLEDLKDLTGVSILAKNSTKKLTADMDIFEVVVPKSSAVNGKSLKSILYFRNHDLVPLGIKQSNKYIYKNVSDIILSPGDVIVIAGHKEYATRFIDELRLLPVAYYPNQSVKPLKMFIVGGLVAGFMITTSMGIFNALQAAIIAVAFLLLSRTISLEEMYESLDSNVLMLLACILSLGVALEKTGAAKLISQNLVFYFGGTSPFVIVAALYLLTSLLTEIMSNNATAALLTPIALNMAKSLEVSEKPLILAVMIAASMSFMTPIGYQTNTMIAAAGGFKFKDFLRVGTGLNIITWVTGSFLIVYMFPFK